MIIFVSKGRNRIFVKKKKFIFLIKFKIINLLILNLILLLILIFIKIENNNRTCICTLGKQENRYIREFVEYYYKIGVDKINLYDNNNMNGERFEEVIGDFIKSGFVRILNWRGKKLPQLKAMNDCYKKNYKKFNWLMFYDIDEYISLADYSNIKYFLNEKKFSSCQLILCNLFKFNYSYR